MNRREGHKVSLAAGMEELSSRVVKRLIIIFAV
jgi:hypothetical protein